MNCDELVELVTAYFDGALTETDRVRFESHLGTCQGCTNYVAQMRETVLVAGSLTADDISSQACDELVAAFRTFNDPAPD